jgi:hypothetical protein
MSDLVTIFSEIDDFCKKFENNCEKLLSNSEHFSNFSAFIHY